MRQILFTIFFALFAVVGCYAQEGSDNKELRLTPRDCLISYKDWVKKDVGYIITAEEKKSFNNLKTNEERVNFIANFWRQRDPSPDTEENEFLEEHYERIKYANENFESVIPGWMTDRGKIYIIWGKPDKIETGYGRFGENLNVPYEKWNYKYISEYCGSVEIIFSDPTQSKEFRISESSETKLVKALNKCSE